MDDGLALPRPDDPRWGPPPGDLAEVPTDFAGDEDEDLSLRLAALGHATRVAARYLTSTEAPGLADAAELAGRGPARLALAGHTVVALAGPTGVGKSSLFNALAGLELSPSGHLRPTTGEAYACVWDVQSADALLDWLGVAPKRRFTRESPLDADDQAALRGLVLIDLPDMDSIADSNRIESDRLVRAVDRVIWVLDPQKYADETVHDDYLRRLGSLRDVTVVVLNQSDQLAPTDLERCRGDLARLVEADGLPGVSVIHTSATTGSGIDELRALLEKAVADRAAALARLEAELAEAAGSLAAVAPGPGPAELDLSEAVPDLADDLAAACGIDALAADAAATIGPRWPWAPERSAPPIAPADPGAVGQAVRQLAERVGAALPEAWSRHVRAAAVRDLDQLPEELARALTVAREDSPGTWRARRYRRSVARQMREATLAVAREVVAPVRRVLRDYGEVHAALERAKAPAAQ